MMPSMEPRRKKIMWCGDAAVASGFAKVTHEVLQAFEEKWDIIVLGVNYLGDPHNFPYPIYPCIHPDYWGLTRVVPLLEGHRPDILIVQNDPWNVEAYKKKAGNVLTVATMPVDGDNCRWGTRLNGLAMAIFWTKHALREARAGGYSGPAEIIPLGVDTNVYRPIERKLARKMARLPEQFHDRFIVGNINRNQPRKRIDLTISMFAEWVKSYDIDDAMLYLHVAPSADAGYDCKQLAQYFGLQNQLILVSPQDGHGIPEYQMANSYSCFDAQMTTTQGEGWGLCTMEGMACGVPQIVPDHSALGEWTEDAVLKIPCSEITVTPKGINAIGALPDRAKTIEALHSLYTSPELRADLREKGLELVRRPEYRWEAIGERYDEVLTGVLKEYKGLQPIG